MKNTGKIYRKCYKCKQEKSLLEDFWLKDKKKGIFMYTCIPCTKILNKEWRLAHNYKNKKPEYSSVHLNPVSKEEREEFHQDIRDMYDEGLTPYQISKWLSVSQSTVMNVLFPEKYRLEQEKYRIQIKPEVKEAQNIRKRHYLKGYIKRQKQEWEKRQK